MCCQGYKAGCESGVSRCHAPRSREAPGRSVGEGVGPALPWMPVVAPEPFPSNVELKVQLEKLQPQVPVLECYTAPVAPSLTLPAEDKAAHAVDQEFGVRVEFD